jgi:hypothetical protein
LQRIADPCETEEAIKIAAMRALVFFQVLLRVARPERFELPTY